MDRKGSKKMYAVIRTRGKQYKVALGDKVKVEKIAGVVGDFVTISDVLAVGEGNNLKVGNPVLEDVSVETKIVEQNRDKKIIVFKSKRKKNYKRKQGHRQDFTRLEIKAINA